MYRFYRDPRNVESHVDFAASASNGINASQVCGSISSLRGCLLSNQCDRVQSRCLRRQRSTTHPLRYPGLSFHGCKLPGLVNSYRSSGYEHIIVNDTSLRTAPCWRSSWFSCPVSLLKLCNESSMACSCFNYLMLCPTMSHLRLHIWQLSSEDLWVFKTRSFV